MLDRQKFQQLWALFRERFEEHREKLNELDEAIGDGDHGYTMERAFQAVHQAITPGLDDLGAGFDTIAETLAEESGGAIGPLLASLFAEGGLVFQGESWFTPETFSAFLTGGLHAVEEVGGAEEGQKTLLDALGPAARAMRKNIDLPLSRALEHAAAAAEQGAENTANMIAAQGRARFVSERSQGHQDPGATSLALIIRTFADFENGLRSSTTWDSEPQQAFSPPPGKLVNHPDTMIQQDNQGLALAYPDLVRLTDDQILIRARPKPEGKVGLAIGHGGGHTPSMGGFIGPGLLDADVYGPLFTCASGLKIARAIQYADRGAGVVLLVSNHTGDVLNANLALRRSQEIGLEVDSVFLTDDIATAPRERYKDRRGLGGLLFALKIGGGAAEQGVPRDRVVKLIEKTNRRTATLSVAVRPPTHPVTGEAIFDLPRGEIEIGTGVHGEVGVYRGPHLPADDIVDMLLDRLLKDLALFDAEGMLAFVNGSGGTSRMELHLLYRRVHEQLGDQLIAGLVDSFFTTQEMGGFSLSLCAVDQELLKYWQIPASGPCFRWPYQ
jgi:dihydroxyacetone kinase-like protein